MNSLTAAWAMRSKRPATVLIIQFPRRSSESQPYTAGTAGHFSIERNTISSIGALVSSKSNPPADPAPNEARGFHLRPQPAGALGGSRPAGRGLQRALLSLFRRRGRGILARDRLSLPGGYRREVRHGHLCRKGERRIPRLGDLRRADRHRLPRRPHRPLFDAARVRHLARRRAHHERRARLRQCGCENEEIGCVARADQTGDTPVRAHPARGSERLSELVNTWQRATRNKNQKSA